MSDVTAPLPVEQLFGLGVVVDDLDRTIEEYGSFFGIANWQVRRFASGKNLEVLAAGQPKECELLWATGQTANIRFDIVKPIVGSTIFEEFLSRRGPGVMWAWTHTVTPSVFEDKLPLLKREGIPLAETYRFDEGTAMQFLDSVGQFATVVSVLTSTSGTPAEFDSLPVERTVTVDVAPEDERLPIKRPYHFCILTRNRRLSVRENFKRVFGIEEWFEGANDASGSHVTATYQGRKLHEGRFLLTLGRRQRFGVEVVEMAFGDNVYQDMLDVKGEGIHHFMPLIAPQERLDQAIAALAKKGYSVVQDGWVGPIYYGYLAAEGRLADLAIEILSPGPDPESMIGSQNWAILNGPEF